MTEVEAIIAAFLFGLIYNWIVGRLHARFGTDHGLVSLEVVGGVLGVLAIGALIQHPSRFAFHAFGLDFVLSNAQSATWLYLRLFAAAGLPMVVGSMARWLNEQG